MELLPLDADTLEDHQAESIGDFSEDGRRVYEGGNLAEFLIGEVIEDETYLFEREVALVFVEI